MPRSVPRSLALIHPQQQGLLEGFSCGLVALANFIAARDPTVHVRLLDYGLSSESELEQNVHEYVSGVHGQLFVGVTTTTASYQAALRVARLFKALRPDSVLVFGGHHASAQASVVLSSHAEVDFVIRGEGEIALAALLRQYPEFRPIPNLVYREGTGTRENSPAPFLGQGDLDSLSPTFRGWGLRSAPGKFDHVTYVSARGCPLKCAFCAVANEVIRAKSVAAVIADVRILVSEHGYHRIALEDNFFAHSPRRTLELCAALEQLQRTLQFSWDCQTRVESMRRHDVLDAMERAGCEAVYLGVESLNVEQLLDLGKTPSPGPYLQMLEEEVVPQLLASRLDCYINLQLGLRGEEQHHRDQTLAVLRRLGELADNRHKTITVFPQLAVLYPGTAHHAQAIAEKRFGEGSDGIFERFTEWEIRQQPIWRFLGEHFAHGTGGIPEGILMPDELRRGEFHIDGQAVARVATFLREMARLPGVDVFQYGRYLAKEAPAIRGSQPALKGSSHGG